MATIPEALAVAVQHHQAGRLQAAEQIYRQILAVEPNQPDALHLLGVIAHRMGRHEVAVEYIERAIRMNGSDSAFHYNLGNAFLALGRLDDAVACYRRAVEIKPDHAGAHNNLGNALKDQGKLDEAIACFCRALKLKPDFAAADNNLGNVFHAQGKLDDAVACYHRALEHKPDFAEAHNNLGYAFHAQGKLNDAVASCRRALELKPDYAEAHNNLGYAFYGQGKLDDAAACYRRALELKPDYADAHYNQSLLQLLLGDFEHGWPEYERWSRQTKERIVQNFRQPIWDGQPLEGKTILLHAEQGFGDTLQFIRCARMVKRQGGTVVVECQPELATLLTNACGSDRLVPRGKPLPEFDVQAPLMSLPAIFGTTLETIPADVPYLEPDPQCVANWHGELAGDEFKIGLAWQGNPQHKNDRFRSLRLEHFTPLAGLSGVRLFSLQKGPGSEQLADLAGRVPIVDLAPRLHDFADTAAVMRNLDLLITCDSAPAHLAGAIGVRTWVALPAASEWRWLLDRDDSPWYPTLRLYRQLHRNDWTDVIERMRQDLVHAQGLNRQPSADPAH